MKYPILAIALCLTAQPAIAASQPKPAELSATDLAAFQTRTYPASFGTLFPAAISTLQTLGYLNISASKDAGTISAETEAKGKIIYNILWGVGKKKRTQQASLLVEETGPGRSTVKLNLTVNESKSRGLFGTAFKDGQLVRVGEPYQDFYAALDAEVARRGTASGVSSTSPQ